MLIFLVTHCLFLVLISSFSSATYRCLRSRNFTCKEYELMSWVSCSISPELWVRMHQKGTFIFSTNFSLVHHKKTEVCFETNKIKQEWESGRVETRVQAIALVEFSALADLMRSNRKRQMASTVSYSWLVSQHSDVRQWIIKKTLTFASTLVNSQI